jgi:glycosyltransferase involved in cell wall biosynthesis
MQVSVIVPTHGNRDLRLLKASIPKRSDVELIIVDEGKERSYQRNIGIRRAKGRYLLILDSDQSISPGLIDECLDLAKQGFKTLYIPEIIIAKGFFGAVRMFERAFYVGTAIDVPRFVKRKGCPMFDVGQKGTEDSDWGYRLPGERAITKNPLFHHDQIGVIEYFKKKNYYAKSLGRFKERNPNAKILDPKWRCFDVFFENGKWRMALTHPILFLALMIIIFVRGVIYVANIHRKN